MSKLRPVLFWSHLVAGIVAGVVIAIMSFTGTMLAFEKEIIAWAERDVSQVSPPPEAKRLPLDDLLARVREQQPDVRPSGITVSANPSIAVLVSLELREDGRLPPRSLEAIQTLIKTSEPDLPPDALTVMDKSGRSYLAVGKPEVGVEMMAQIRLTRCRRQ